MRGRGGVGVVAVALWVGSGALAGVQGGGRGGGGGEGREEGERGSQSTATARAQARSTVDALLGRLAEIERRLGDGGVPAEERWSLLAEAGRVRAELAERASDDERAVTWLIDAAAGELLGLSRDAADTSVLLGLPTDEQRRRVEETARRAGAILDRADAAATRAAERLERRVLDASGTAEEARARATAAEAALATVVDREQNQRLPYYRGLCDALLAGALEDEAARVAATRRAAAALAEVSLPTLAGEAARRAALGAVLLSLPDPDRAILDAAAQQLRWVEERLRTAEGAAVDASTRQRVRMGLVRVGLEGPAPSGPSWWTRLLDAEAAARAELAASRREPATRPARIGAALQRVLDAVRAEAGGAAGGGADPAALRLLVYAKVSAAVEPGVSLSALPAEVGFARAVTLARADRGSGEAAALLEQVAGRADAGAELRAEALWERAVLVSGGDANAQEVALARVVREHPETEAALRAARRLAELGADWVPGGAVGEARAERLGLAFELLVRREPSERAWTGALASRLRAFGREPREETLEAVVVAYDALRGGERSGAHGESVADALRGGVAALRGEPSVIGTRVAVAQIASEWAERCVPARADAFALEHALARLDAGEPERALGILDVLAPRPSLAATPDLSAAVSLALGQARRRTGDTAGAFAALRAVADRYETPGPGRRPETYWAAWAEILEILRAERGTEAGARADDVRVQVRRLELLDPALGGGEAAGRIRAVKAAVGE